MLILGSAPSLFWVMSDAKEVLDFLAEAGFAGNYGADFIFWTMLKTILKRTLYVFIVSHQPSWKHIIHFQQCEPPAT